MRSVCVDRLEKTIYDGCVVQVGCATVVLEWRMPSVARGLLKTTV